MVTRIREGLTFRGDLSQIPFEPPEIDPTEIFYFGSEIRRKSDIKPRNTNPKVRLPAPTGTDIKGRLDISYQLPVPIYTI